MRATRDAVLGGEASPVRSEPRRPAPFIVFSIVLHAAAVALVLHPARWRWAVLLLHDNSPLSLEVLATLLEHLNARGLKSVSLPTACSLSS
jgi:hypothetical protein